MKKWKRYEGVTPSFGFEINWLKTDFNANIFITPFEAVYISQCQMTCLRFFVKYFLIMNIFILIYFLEIRKKSDLSYFHIECSHLHRFTISKNPLLVSCRTLKQESQVNALIGPIFFLIILVIYKPIIEPNNWP